VEDRVRMRASLYRRREWSIVAMVEGEDIICITGVSEGNGGVPLQWA
jgi:hypothetical protein